MWFTPKRLGKGYPCKTSIFQRGYKILLNSSGHTRQLIVYMDIYRTHEKERRNMRSKANMCNKKWNKSIYQRQGNREVLVFSFLTWWKEQKSLVLGRAENLQGGPPSQRPNIPSCIIIAMKSSSQFKVTKSDCIFIKEY